MRGSSRWGSFLEWTTITGYGLTVAIFTTRAPPLLTLRRQTTAWAKLRMRCLMILRFNDPRQGHGSWLFPDEFRIADDLATKLHSATADEPMEDWGKVLLRHPLWRDIRSDAQELHGLIRRNGQGSPNNVR
ncbi:MAG: hypothetical protein IPF76_08805 [Sphingopyxis sp.]|nr:hypothetical protein [Sphingopyxis sp.]